MNFQNEKKQIKWDIKANNQYHHTGALQTNEWIFLIIEDFNNFCN